MDRRRTDEKTHVGDTQSGEVISLVLAAHSLAGGSTALAQMRGHVTGAAGGAGRRGTACSQSLEGGSTDVAVEVGQTGAGLALGSHGVLEGTLCGEMLAGTDTTLDLHLLELLLLLVLLGGGLLGGAGLEADLGSEDDVLAEGGGVGLGACGAAGLETHLGPGAALGDAGLLVFPLDDGADALCALDLLAVIVEENGDNRLGAVLVLCVLGRGQGGGEIGLVVFGPVGASWLVGHGVWDEVGCCCCVRVVLRSRRPSGLLSRPKSLARRS